VTKINASKFKEQRLALLDNLETDDLIITKRGRPVARLTPIQTDCADLVGSMKGEIIVDPADDLFSTGVKWNAES
jgi:prevent-host-death family protein